MVVRCPAFQQSAAAPAGRRRARGRGGRGATLPSRAEPRRRPGGHPDKRDQRAWLQHPAELSSQQEGPRPAAPGAATMSSTVNNGAASVPSPPDAANGFPQPGVSSGAWPRAEEELRAAEPGLVKRAHREILDHERKRRVELKCMELQEMMEEQGYSEEETRQKVRTFRQMLMEKEGMLTREDRPGGHIVAETPRLIEGAELGLEYAPFDEDDGPVDCDCPASCYRGHRGDRTKHWSSSSASPPPKKKKKKKGGHRRSRKKRRLDSECSCGSSSPLRKKKKSVKKHRRDRSESGSRRKRRHRSRSPKSKRKEKNKERKRPHTESPGRRSHRHSSGSSHSPSLSSHYSNSRSPSRLSPKHRDDGRKTGSQRSSGSRSPSPSGGSGWGSPQQNGGSRQRSGAHGGRPGSAQSPLDGQGAGPAHPARQHLAVPGQARRARGEELVAQPRPAPALLELQPLALQIPLALGGEEGPQPQPLAVAQENPGSGQGRGEPREARRGRGRPRPAPLPQLLAHPQAAPGLAQLHGAAAHHQCPEASHPLLPTQPLVLLQLPEQRLLKPEPQPQPQPRPQPRKLQQPQSDPQPHTKSLPDPHSQLPQPEQLREWGLLSPGNPASCPLAQGKARAPGAMGGSGACTPLLQRGPGTGEDLEGGGCPEDKEELDSAASGGSPPHLLLTHAVQGTKSRFEHRDHHPFLLDASSPG
uniref:Serine/arginine repetitive matrix 3 n=1 Tax=Bos taurus TaxID=9913 RepID=E1BJS4_BOVIN